VRQLATGGGPAACLACVLSAVALLGCGGVRASTASTAPARPPRGRRLAYRWFVPIHGQAPSIAAENRAPGTSAWRLEGPPELIGGAAHGQIAGYVAKQSLAAGETQRVYVNAPAAHRVAVSVYRMGWYHGRGGRLVLQSELLQGVHQPPCSHRSDTGLTECRWRPTISFPIPRALPSGVYTVKLEGTDGSQADGVFVVRRRGAAPVIVELPTATWEAYNTFGGDSLYPGGKPVGATGATQGVEVSYDRPYTTQTGAGEFFIREVAIVRFLERYGYPVSYTTSDSLDREPGQVRGARALIDAGHSEYWSAREAGAFTRARDRGTSLLFLSSDTIAWRVRYARATGASSQNGEADHRIVAYKQFATRDPDQAEQTGLFPGGAASLTGSAYDGCITPRLSRPGPPGYRYYAWSPAPRLSPSWLFAGSGVRADTRIPGIVGYELDERTALTPPGTVTVGDGGGACLPDSEPSPVRGTRAQSTLYSAHSGAFVFATGTLGWLYALSPVPQASPDAPTAPDRRVIAMTRNLLARALATSAAPGRTSRNIRSDRSVRRR
jgi:hypothetical protein